MARVLIIDDDDQLRAMLRQMLERAGYDVVEAMNGNEGVTLYRERPADVVITDILMPGKEGLEVIMELRREFPDAKIIAISGGGRTGTLDFLPVAQTFGALLAFQKPFDRQEMLAAVRELVQ